MKKQLRAWIALGIITIIAGLSLSMTNEVTKDVIKKQTEEAIVQARLEVLPSADRFEPVEMKPEQMAPLADLYVGLKGEEPQGYVGTVLVKGYGGPVQVIAGIDLEGVVTGITVGGPDFKETAGLGARSKDAAFTDQFANKPAPIKVVKAVADRGTNTIDAITAATITTNAVTGGVNAIAGKVDGILNPVSDIAAEGTTFTASQQGFAGPVAVFVTVKDDGTITALTVGDDQFAETEGFGMGAKEPGFTKQFIGKTLPIALEDIDAVSGATYTTKAVVGAINQAYEEKNIAAPAAPEGTRYTASRKGFAGPVAVFVTVKDDGTITALEIGDDQFAETEGFGMGAKEPAFIKQFIGKILPLKVEDIDAVSGATYTTNAVVDAINAAFEEKTIDDVAPAEATQAPAEATQIPAEATPAPTEETQAPATVPEGTRYTASKQGFAGPVAVFVTVKDDGTITALEIGDEQFAETEGFGMGAKEPVFIKQFIGKTLPLKVEDIDAVSGATYTTNAVVDAINAAFEEKTIDDVAPAEATQAPAEATQIPAEATPAPTEETQAPATVPEGTRYTASKQGFAGPVAVFVTVKDDGTITALEIGDEQFAETEGFGMGAKEPVFIKQFIGKTLPLKAEEIDAISGATYTTNAVVDAINAAFEEKVIDGAAPAEATQAPAEEVQAPAAAPEGTHYTASKQGFAGPVAVFVTVKDDGTITALEIGDEQFAETEGFGMRAKEPAFINQFIGKTLPLKAEDIDAVSGATYTTNAVVEAINAAFEEKAIDTSDSAAPQTEEQLTSAVPEAVQTIAGESRKATASSMGYADFITVTLTLNADNTIAALEVGE